MHFIKNYQALETSSERKIVLDLIETAYSSIQPMRVLKNNFVVDHKILSIKDKTVNLGEFERIFLIGFGKGSAKIASLVEAKLGDLLTEGDVIDITGEKLSKVNFTLGTHPLPSQVNFDFTEKLLEKFRDLTYKDLVLVITCGGGSALLELPQTLTLAQSIDIFKQLLKSGANINQLNIVRKHLSKVKGGGLAKYLYPATVYNLVFSDVPGNDLSTIASGPLVLDRSTKKDAWEIIEKFNINQRLDLVYESFIETTKDAKYFENITHVVLISNRTALNAMEKKAKSMVKSVKTFSNTFQGEARIVGKKLIESTYDHSILLAAGETTVKVTGSGKGGRNQELVLGALDNLAEGILITSFASDGWDNIEAAGAIGDMQTIKKAKDAGIEPKKFLEDNDSLSFFKAVGDAILTGKLSTNVSDLMIVFKK